MKIPFSVVIPLYNKKNCIRRTLDSILSQTYKNYEIVVVNDGSTDGSEAIISDYIKKHDNIRLINQENAGVSAARNTGVKHAKHELICFLDSDDEWMPNFLNEMAELVNLFPENHLYSVRHEIIEKNGDTIFPDAYGEKGFKGLISDFITTYKESDGIIHSSAVCVRKPLFLKLGGFPVGQTQGEDVYLWLLYGLHTDLVFSNTVCTRYYRDTENRSDQQIKSSTLPYQFVYFYSLINQQQKNSNENVTLTIDANNRKKLRAYLQKNALLHIAGLKLNNKNKAALSHTKMIFTQDKLTGLLCFLLLSIPSKLLQAVKNLRDNGRNKI